MLYCKKPNNKINNCLSFKNIIAVEGAGRVFPDDHVVPEKSYDRVGSDFEDQK